MDDRHKGDRSHGPVPPASTSTVLWRGLRCRCPACGSGQIFATRFTLHELCEHCGLRYLQNDGDTFGFMYVSTAFFTGIIIAFMWFFRPAHPRLGQALVIIAAVITMVGTLRPRKGLAVALEYLTSHRPHRHS